MTLKVRKRQRDDAEVRREQILGEAIRIIGRRGYHAFSIQELAQSCGLTNGGLLYHFGSKEQLLIALLQDRDRRDAEVVASVVGIREGDWTDVPYSALIDTLHAIVARNSTQAEFVRLYALLQAEALDQGHPAYDFFLAREAATLEVFARLVRPHAPAPQATARQLLGLMSGLEQQWLRADQGFDLVAEWDRAVVLLLPPPADA